MLQTPSYRFRRQLVTAASAARRFGEPKRAAPMTVQRIAWRVRGSLDLLLDRIEPGDPFQTGVSRSLCCRTSPSGRVAAASVSVRAGQTGAAEISIKPGRPSFWNIATTPRSAPHHGRSSEPSSTCSPSIFPWLSPSPTSSVRRQAVDHGREVERRPFRHQDMRQQPFCRQGALDQAGGRGAWVSQARHVQAPSGSLGNDVEPLGAIFADSEPWLSGSISRWAEPMLRCAAGRTWRPRRARQRRRARLRAPRRQARCNAYLTAGDRSAATRAACFNKRSWIDHACASLHDRILS